jgi:hypothetical protein
MSGGRTVAGRAGDVERRDNKEGKDASTSAVGGGASGKTIGPFSFDPLALGNWRDESKEAMSGEGKIPGSGELCIVSKNDVSIGCSNVVVIGLLEESTCWKSGIG